jgi:hypothetical protein
MPKINTTCKWCNTPLQRWPSQFKKENYCDYSCQIKQRNKTNNPSWTRDVSGEKNPMYQQGHKISGEKNGMWGRRGKNCPNWKGGRSVRGDGYVRVNINGERVLEHRYILEKSGLDVEGRVVHHIDHNPSNNNISNLMVFDSQSEHVKYENAQKNVLW